MLEYDSLYPAKVGFSDGISMNIPGSGTPEIINITTRSNVGRPGIWVFRIDGENIYSTRPITEGVIAVPQLVLSMALLSPTTAHR